MTRFLATLNPFDTEFTSALGIEFISQAELNSAKSRYEINLAAHI